MWCISHRAALGSAPLLVTKTWDSNPRRRLTLFNGRTSKKMPFSQARFMIAEKIRIRPNSKKVADWRNILSVSSKKSLETFFFLLTWQKIWKSVIGLVLLGPNSQRLNRMIYNLILCYLANLGGGLDSGALIFLLCSLWASWLIASQYFL